MKIKKYVYSLVVFGTKLINTSNVSAILMAIVSIVGVVAKVRSNTGIFRFITPQILK
jgi:hypothetical protein